MGNVLPEVLQTRCHWNWTLGYSSVTPRRSPSRRFSPERDRLWTGFWMFLRSGSEFVRQGNGLAVGECGAGGGEQVELRLDACELGRFEQAVEQRGDLGAALGARAVMIFPAQNHTAQATLRGVVVERDARVVEEERQALPQTQHVGDGLAKPALRQGSLSQGPVPDLAHERPRALLSQTVPQGERRDRKSVV